MNPVTAAIRTKRTALYRLLAANGRLLYVGISGNPDVRWGTHSNKQPWWSEVADRKVEWFPTREDASAAEIIAIREERPLYNKQHSLTSPNRAALAVRREDRIPVRPSSSWHFEPQQPLADDPEQRTEYERNLAVVHEALKMGLLTCADLASDGTELPACHPERPGCDGASCPGSAGRDALATVGPARVPAAQSDPEDAE